VFPCCKVYSLSKRLNRKLDDVDEDEDASGTAAALQSVEQWSVVVTEVPKTAETFTGVLGYPRGRREVATYPTLRRLPSFIGENAVPTIALNMFGIAIKSRLYCIQAIFYINLVVVRDQQLPLIVFSNNPVFLPQILQITHFQWLGQYLICPTGFEKGDVFRE
jgi:hypothetical protein